MTISLVVDASFAYKLILPGERQSEYIAKMTEWMQHGVELYAPSLWIFELTSAFNKAVHFKVLTEEQGVEALQLALLLQVQLVTPDEQQVRLAYGWTRKLNRAAAYDSFYLALAETLQAPFWTGDKRLCNAVAQPWVNFL